MADVFGLCQNCLSLDLLSESTWEHLRASPTTGLVTSRLTLDSKCPLCRVLQKLPKGLTPPNRDGPIDYIKLRYAAHRGLDNFDAPTFEHFCVAFIDDLKRYPWIPAVGRRISQAPIDSSLVMSWLNVCESTHQRCMDERSSVQARPSLSNLRLIDVAANCIVSPVQPCSYLALSYVWGNTTQPRMTRANQDILMAPNGLSHLLNDLPATIVDAMKFTALIRHRYLWVDTLCLVCDDETDFSLGLGSMAEIYGRSFATIVAASGHNADSGLFAKRQYSEYRPTQVWEQIGPGISAMVIKDEDIRNRYKRPYFRRAWTLQEELLSFRRIFFAEGHLYFQCRCCQWSEETDDHNHPERNLDSIQARFNPMRYLNELRPGRDPKEVYQTLIRDFTSRDLTFSADIMDAFRGMLTYLEQLMQTRFLYGLPHRMLEFGLIFNTFQRPSRRRSLFPSYSWAGWESALRHYQEASNTWTRGVGSAEVTWITWFEGLPSGCTRPLSEVTASQPQSYDRRPNTPTPGPLPTIAYSLLRFWTFTMTFALGTPHCTSDNRYVINELLNATNASCGQVSIDNIDMVPGSGQIEVVLLCKAQRSLAYSLAPPIAWGNIRHKEDEVECLDPLESPFYWALAVRWQGGIAERVGLCTVCWDKRDSLDGEGAEWREIVLG